MSTKQKSPPTPKNNETTTIVTKKDVFILMIILSAIAFGYQKLNESKPPTIQTGKDLMLIINTKNFGSFDLYNLKISEVRGLQKVFMVLQDTHPEVLAEIAKHEDDLQKLNRVLTESGALITDMQLLSWAIQALDRMPAGLRDLILEKICQALPSLKVCGEKYPQSQQNNVAKEVKHLGDEVYIEDLGISVRGYNVLKAEKLHRVSDVLKKIKECETTHGDWRIWFKRLRKCSVMTVLQIEEAIRGLGPEYKEFMDQVSK